MNIQRFTAPTAREALAKARLTFGDGTLILSNRPTEHGVEVVATTEESLGSLDQAAPQNGTAANAPAARPAPGSYKDVASKVEDDATQLAMSTLSFQDYVRERMLRRRHEEASNQNAPARAPRSLPQEPTPAASPAIDNAAPPKPIPVRKPAATAAASSALPRGIVEELQSMKELIEDRFNTLNWLGQARQNPIQANLMLKLIRSGYSPTLARAILERMPEQNDGEVCARWVMDVLERNLKTDADSVPLHIEGGTFALIGATGVGKTTTAAKLAGLCARAHGPGSVGLITLDTYRVGAHEQLRAYGKMLGVVAHLAHDRAALKDLLELLSGKKMVLIDTTGLAPHDPRKREMMDLLDLPQIKRLLVLNACSHGDTLDDVVSCFKQATAQQIIFSKIDEAVKLGPAIDAAIRHQLVLRGVTNGQRVPEDWEAANAAKLVRQSLRAGGNAAFEPKLSELGFFFGQSNTHSTHKGHLDA